MCLKVFDPYRIPEFDIAYKVFIRCSADQYHLGDLRSPYQNTIFMTNRGQLIAEFTDYARFEYNEDIGGCLYTPRDELKLQSGFFHSYGSLEVAQKLRDSYPRDATFEGDVSFSSVEIRKIRFTPDWAFIGSSGPWGRYSDQDIDIASRDMTILERVL